jgi:hypothetical protein
MQDVRNDVNMLFVICDVKCFDRTLSFVQKSSPWGKILAFL